ncbi:MAG: hypothetical protein ACFCBW_17240 [Candidatus Competibacterales bacterium]
MLLLEGYRLVRIWGGDADPAVQQLIRQVALLRRDVWLAEGKRTPGDDEEAGWCEPEDAIGHHVLVTWQESLVGAARMSLHQTVNELPDRSLYVGLETRLRPPLASLNRLVTHPDQRGQGLSRVILVDQLAHASELGVATVVLDCPLSSVTYHQGMGFEVIRAAQPGQVFPDLEWVVMARRLGH